MGIHVIGTSCSLAKAFINDSVILLSILQPQIKTIAREEFEVSTNQVLIKAVIFPLGAFCLRPGLFAALNFGLNTTGERFV